MAVKKKLGKKNVVMVQIPLSSLRCISSYPKEKKLICEINTDDLRTLNSAETLDEIINAARMDYALGKYKTFTSAKALIAELRS